MAGLRRIAAAYARHPTSKKITRARPWMALGLDTFAGDVLRRLGVDNVLAGSADRYPRFDPAEVAAQIVAAPDELVRGGAHQHGGGDQVNDE